MKIKTTLLFLTTMIISNNMFGLTIFGGGSDDRDAYGNDRPLIGRGGSLVGWGHRDPYYRHPSYREEYYNRHGYYPRHDDHYRHGYYEHELEENRP